MVFANDTAVGFAHLAVPFEIIARHHCTAYYDALTGHAWIGYWADVAACIQLEAVFA